MDAIKKARQTATNLKALSETLKSNNEMLQVAQQELQTIIELDPLVEEYRLISCIHRVHLTAEKGKELEIAKLFPSTWQSLEQTRAKGIQKLNEAFCTFLTALPIEQKWTDEEIVKLTEFTYFLEGHQAGESSISLYIECRSSLVLERCKELFEACCLPLEPPYSSKAHSCFELVDLIVNCFHSEALNSPFEKEPVVERVFQPVLEKFDQCLDRLIQEVKDSFLAKELYFDFICLLFDLQHLLADQIILKSATAKVQCALLDLMPVFERELDSSLKRGIELPLNATVHELSCRLVHFARKISRCPAAVVEGILKELGISSLAAYIQFLIEKLWSVLYKSSISQPEYHLFFTLNNLHYYNFYFPCPGSGIVEGQLQQARQKLLSMPQESIQKASHQYALVDSCLRLHYGPEAFLC